MFSKAGQGGQNRHQSEFGVCLRSTKMSFFPGKMCVWRRGEVWDAGLVLRAAQLLLCPLGWCGGFAGAAELLEELQHWAVPAWNVRTAQWGCLSSTCSVNGCHRACSVIFVIPSIIFFLCPLHKSSGYVCARPVPTLTSANLSKRLASPSVSPAPLLSNDNPKWWVKRAFQNPVDLPVCLPLRAAGSVLAVRSSHSTVMRFSLWWGKAQKKKIFFSFKVVYFYFSVPITQILTTAGTDGNFENTCSKRIWW